MISPGHPRDRPLPSIPRGGLERFARLDAALAGATRGWGHSLAHALEPHLLRFEAGRGSLREGRGVTRRRLACAAAGLAPGDALADGIVDAVARMERAITLGIAAERLDVDALLSMHGVLLDGSPGAGAVRRGLVDLGLARAPTPAQLPAGLARLAVLLRRDDLPGTLIAALAHAELVNLHPFDDGNGRAARALVRVVLGRRLRGGRALPPIMTGLAFTPAPFRGANEVYRRGIAEPWLGLFARAVDDALALTAELGDQVRAAAGPGLAKLGAREPWTPHLWRTPVMTVPGLARAVGRPSAEVERRLLALERRGRVARAPALGPDAWHCPSVLSLLDALDRGLLQLTVEGGA